MQEAGAGWNHSSIGDLPVLTSVNYAEHQEWHDYFKAVYGEALISDVDLNEFTWFYWFAPAKVVLHFDHELPSLLSQSHIPWVGSIYGHPETLMNEIGFFVYHKKSSAAHNLSPMRLEVLRTCKPLRLFGKTYPIDTSSGTVWFLRVHGSGILLNTRDLSNGVSIAIDNRPLLLANHSYTSWNGVEIDWYFLQANNVSMILFLEAFRWLNLIPRSEVVVRYDAKSPVCCPSFRFTRGYSWVRPCECRNTGGFLTCAPSPTRRTSGSYVTDVPDMAASVGRFRRPIHRKSRGRAAV